MHLLSVLCGPPSLLCVAASPGRDAATHNQGATRSRGRNAPNVGLRAGYGIGWPGLRTRLSWLRHRMAGLRTRVSWLRHRMAGLRTRVSWLRHRVARAADQGVLAAASGGPAAAPGGTPRWAGR